MVLAYLMIKKFWGSKNKKTTSSSEDTLGYAGLFGPLCKVCNLGTSPMGFKQNIACISSTKYKCSGPFQSFPDAKSEGTSPCSICG